MGVRALVGRARGRRAVRMVSVVGGSVVRLVGMGVR